MRQADGSFIRQTKPELGFQTHKIPDAVFRVPRNCDHQFTKHHPATFPVPLAEQVITAYSDPDQIVYEPFCGSGSSIIAAHRAARRCYAMEISPQDRDVAVKRIERETGLFAYNQHGEPFDDCGGIVAHKRPELVAVSG